jgi:hypothetical protein
MSRRAQLLCVWGAPATMVLFFLGFQVIAGLIPPPAPSASAQEIAAVYREDPDLKRLGLLITVLAGACSGPFVAVIAAQMRRIEGSTSPLAYTQLGLGMVGVVFFVLPPMLLTIATFRPDRDPELIQLVNDLAWIPLVGLYSPALLQNFSIAVAVLQAPDEEVYPRWVGYFNVYTAIVFLAAALIVFFQTGPFAWNGPLAFYLPMVDFFTWYLVMFWMTRRAILRQADVAA